jgi:hypothetical protein
VGYHSLMTTAHSSNVNLPSSGQQVTVRLSARKVSVARENRTHDPVVRDATIVLLSWTKPDDVYSVMIGYCLAVHSNVAFCYVATANRVTLL